MLKKSIIIALLAAAMLTGCSSGNEENVSASSESSNASKPAATTPEAENDEQGIEVDKNLLSVDVTLPASLFEGQDIDQAVADAKEQDGVSDVTKNEDGSISYKMTKSAHSKMMADLETSVKETADELKSGENFASIKDVAYNDSFTEFTLVVDKAAYESSFDGIATMGLGFQSMYVQVFDGVPTEKIKATISIQDEATGEVFHTVVYPDDMNEN